ncbi:MAG: TldD/PmbA family protein [Myxococcaceae bacterium]
MILPFSCVVVALASSLASADGRLVLLDAMERELARSVQKLSLGEHRPPYFVSYQLKDVRHVELSSRYGALFDDESYRNRSLFVDVRVGDYSFDNSQEDEGEFSFSLKPVSYQARKEGPLDDDAMALRTALWLATDEQYKGALANYLKKKGDEVYNVADPKRPSSFSREKPERFVEPAPTFSYDKARWSQVVRALSARLKGIPEIFDSEVRLAATRETRLFVSSEGGRIVTESLLYGIHIVALTRSDDGQLLEDSRDFYSPTEAGLPSEAVLQNAAQELTQALLAIRKAPAIDPYTGPAILEARAAGVLFHEAVGHRLEGNRQAGEQEGKTFKGQVGQRLLPDFISLVDDPTLKSWESTPLNGFYRFDDEGVAANRAQLIRKGVLQGFLLSRRPVEGFRQSNGHGRAQGNRRPIARMANLLVYSEKQVDDTTLKKMLVAEAKRQGKPFGLIIRDITGGNTNTSNYGYQAFKGIPRLVYRVDVRDGQETLVRGVEIVGTPLASMNRILATGKTSGVFNGYCGAESGNVPVSTVAPAVLLQEIELQRSVEGKDRPPILPNPGLSEAAAG